ncbi:MAG: hypothetical protein JNK60_23005, partial [Acidobacteria bacterium]|nr:hypothetical protein [Acidobacteriota bacterium]
MKLLARLRPFQASHLAFIALGCALFALPAQGQAPIVKAESTEPDQIRRPGDIDPGRGVTLYAETSLRGANQTFGFDVQDLRRTEFGADRARSVRVDRGCVATLYSRTGFRGRSVTLRGDENDLRNTPLGREESASLQVDCRGGGGGGGGPVGGPGGWGGPPVVDPRGVQGMTLFTGFRLTGEGMTFDRDVPDLSRTPFGARRARSVGISPGCLGVLYQGTYYRGRSSTFRGDDKDLRNTEVGADTGSSLRVVCGGGGRPGSWDEPSYGVTLYEDGRLSGASQIFDRDVPDLDRTRFGSRRASSVDVAPGGSATLDREPFF